VQLRIREAKVAVHGLADLSSVGIIVLPPAHRA
jgi:hypothetical protein